LTDLPQFRRQQQIKKQTKQLREQIDKQNAELSNLKTELTSHLHENYVTKQELHQNYALKMELPEPYVHPKTGVCPQKPQSHKHETKDVVGLKNPEPYTLEDLKRDHPTLKEPYLHDPKPHSHPATEIMGKIQPEQIETEGLDADTVDQKHAKDLIAEVAKKVKRAYVGGGPHGNTHAPGEIDEINADITRVAPTRDADGYIASVQYYAGATLKYNAIINRDAEHYLTSVQYYVADSLKFTLTINRDTNKKITSIERS